MIIWDSESDPRCYDATEHQFFIDLGGGNGAFRLADYETTGAHYTGIGFLGPQARESAEKWDKFVGDDDERDVNTDTERLIRACFGL